MAILSSPASALDPRVSWETMETPHFEIHYHQGEYQLAARVARFGEIAHKRLAPLLDHEPSERCHIVISDDTDFANGSATPLLRNTITLYAPPPDSRSTLNDFDDYAWELVSHEYTHILHLDTVIGLPDVTNAIFGKLWIPNGAQPRWFIEGLAVFEESEQSASGRERSSQEEMTVRAEIFGGTFPTIAQLSNIPLQWPRGDGWYTIGGRFLSYIGDRWGAGALRDISHDYGGRAIPFGLNLSARTVVGKTYLELYDEFKKEETERANEVLEEVREQGETHFESLTSLGELTRSPRYSRDGKQLYYSSQGPHRLAEIRERVLATGADRRLTDNYSDSNLAVTHTGKILYSRIEIFQRYDEVEDLYSLDPLTGDSTRVTRGMRASEPDEAPDGSIVFVWRRPGGHTAIAELKPGSDQPRILYGDTALEPVGAPRVSPDGKWVAFLHHRDGSWDLQLVARDTLELVDVTRDRSIERDPSWTPDGQAILFSSDRSGVYDLYRYRLADKQIDRLTRVVTGAFEPQLSPDSSELVFVSYSANGYDLARMPYDRSGLGKPPPVAQNERPRPVQEPPRDLFPSHPYEPLKTLRPYFWLPFFATDAVGNTVGALTQGSDIVGLHEYTAAAWWGIDSHQPGYSAAYTSRAQFPDLTLLASRDVVDIANIGCDPNICSQRDIQFGARADFTFPNVERSWALAIGYDLDHVANNTVVPELPPPREGFLGSIYAQLSYSSARRFVRSISIEEGWRATLTARIADPALGGDYRYRLATTAISTYLRMPWAMHQVLALRASGGIGLSDISSGRLFSLGGFGVTDPVRTLLNLSTAPIRTLRGFRSSSFTGDSYVLGSAEYRVPIADLEVGAWTLPFYLRRLHGAAFTDIGDAFDWKDPDAGSGRRRHHFYLHAGAGAELRLELVLGYVLPTDFRAGCARGLERSTVAVLDCYATLGGIF